MAKHQLETLPVGSLFQIPLYAGAVFQVLDIRSYSPSGAEKGPTRGAWKIGQFDKGVYDGSNPDRATIHYFRANRSVEHIRGERAQGLIDQTTPNSGFPRAVWNTPEMGGKIEDYND